MRRSRSTPSLGVPRGERVLATAVRTDTDTVVGGTREALYVPGRVPWETVATADWHQDDEVLRVVEIAGFGESAPVHVLPLRDPNRLLQLLRERVTASFVLQRHVPLGDRLGARILGRRPPTGGTIAWFVEYDDGLDPEEPAVAAQIDTALAAARGEVGE